MSSTPVEEAVRATVDAPFAVQFPRQGRRLPGVRFVARTGGAGLVWLAVFVPYLSQRPFTGTGLAAVTVVAAIWGAALRGAFAAGQGAITIGPSALIGSFTGLVAIAAIDPWFPALRLGPTVLVGVAVGVCATAATWEWFVQRTSLGSRRVLVVGTEDLATAIAEEVECAAPSRFALIGRVDADQPATAADDVFCVGELAELGAVVEAQRPDIVVLADERSYALAVDRLLDVAGAGFRVVGLASFFEYAFGRVPLPHLTPAWFMGVLHLRQPVYARWSKRVFDLVVAFTGLLLAAPLLPVIALLVRQTPGPIMCTQTRLGERGRRFTIYKFRTMIRDAEASGKAQWASSFDQRVTPVGRFLRRTHLDEIPQLWNVLRGDMSIVGPRPERPEFVTILEAAVPFWSRRLLIKPGLTGWAQIRSDQPADCANAADKLSYDLWYIRHRNLAVDVAVCLRTVGLVLCSLLPPRPWRRPLLFRFGKGAGV